MTKPDTTWVLQQLSRESLTWAQNTAKELADNNIGMTQLRKFFGALRKLENQSRIGDLGGKLDVNRLDDIKREFLLLRPRLAYTAARSNNKVYVGFGKEMDVLLDAVYKMPEAQFTQGLFRFTNLMEAVVAYHKSYEFENAQNRQHSRH